MNTRYIVKVSLVSLMLVLGYVTIFSAETTRQTISQASASR